MAHKHHASHTRTAHHHRGVSDHHSEHCSSGHKSHRREHYEPKTHTAGHEPAHNKSGSDAMHHRR